MKYLVSVLAVVISLFGSFTYAQYSDFAFYKPTPSDQKTIRSVISMIKNNEKNNPQKNIELSNRLNSMLFSINPTKQNHRLIYLLKRIVDEIYVAQSVDEYDHQERKINLMMGGGDIVGANKELSTFALKYSPDKRPSNLLGYYLLSSTNQDGSLDLLELYSRYPHLMQIKTTNSLNIKKHLINLRLEERLRGKYTSSNFLLRDAARTVIDNTSYGDIVNTNDIIGYYLLYYYSLIGDDYLYGDITPSSRIMTSIRDINKKGFIELKKIINDMLLLDLPNDYSYRSNKIGFLHSMGLIDESLKVAEKFIQKYPTYENYYRYSKILFDSQGCSKKNEVISFIKKSQQMVLQSNAYEFNSLNNTFDSMIQSIIESCESFDQKEFDQQKASLRQRYDSN